MVSEIKVDFPEDTIKQISGNVSFSNLNFKQGDRDAALRSLVDNAIRVYLQLKIIAKDKSSVTVEADGKRYIISLQ